MTTTVNGTSQAPKSIGEEFLKELASTSTSPLWNQMKRMNPPLPKPTAVPYVWRYDELRPYLLRAGDLVKDKEAERRVLLLKNPNGGKYGFPVFDQSNSSD